MKDVVGYEGLYQVTSCGKVWSYKNERFLKPRKNNDYLRVTLCKDGEMKDYYIHRLVAEAYIPNPDNLPEVNHKDENKLNNCVNNLEWCSKDYNRNYGTRTERSALARSIPVYCLELNKVFSGISQAARELGLNPSHICECCKGKLKTTGGLHFRYANE